MRALRLARLAEALVGANAPELIDLRGPLGAAPADGWAILWRRARVLAEDAVSPAAAFGPFGRCTSLFRRAEAPRARSDTLAAYVWLSQGFAGGPVSRFSPELLAGMGKLFRLGSPMMLLWKSSKLTGASKSMLSA